MMEVRKILVPIDFSENSIKITKAALGLAQRFEAKLLFLFVVQSLEDYSGFFVPHMPVAKFEEELFASAEKRMVDYLAEHVPAEAAARSQVLSGDVAEEIMGFAADEKVDLIIMGTHGYKGLERILFGSVAEKVVKGACCPVLTINPYRTCLEEKKA